MNQKIGMEEEIDEGEEAKDFSFGKMSFEKRTLGALLMEIVGHFHVIRLLLLLLLLLLLHLFRRRHDGALWRIPLRLARGCLNIIVSVGSNVEVCCPPWRHSGRVGDDGLRGFFDRTRVNNVSGCEMFRICSPSTFFSPSGFFSLSLPSCFFSALIISFRIMEDMVMDGRD